MKHYTQIAKNIAIIVLSVAGNVLIKSVTQMIPNMPLFMDTIFTVAATFCGGLVPGLIVGLLTNVVSSGLASIFTPGIGIRYLYSLCNMATALVVFLFCKKAKMSEMKPLDLALLSILVCLTNSVVGGLISTFLYRTLEMSSPDYIVAEMMLYNIPMPVAAIISRIPINMVDKLIAVVLGYGIARLVGKLNSKPKTNID